ncbi:BTAD domain-containing putative transcriptional regulator [Luteimonas sp. 100069]|uniref:tetratricopeptide repeat protein n=1 Tax=Luteimonas sp. 100069 TaxID=2006109 RepID=UPI000F511346|nr:BTAD domain-containing putative transcriptional regulator [Luteimonas sp. 100069]RPD84080.1 hypothetical protein EGK76_13370 [Luteimonas sp. 100069]
MTMARRIVFVLFVLSLGSLSLWLFATRGAADALESDLARARAHLAAGERAQAAALARQVLAREPLRGEAFALLAPALAGTGTPAEVLARYEVAVRRAPRDAHVRSWLAVHALRHGDYASAADQLDALMTVSPRYRDAAMAALGQLVADPDFADALARHFVDRPQWRGRLLRYLESDGPPGALDTLHGALGRHGQLDQSDVARWLAGLIRGGRWGEAYAAWVGTLPGLPERVPQPWNGAFANAPTSVGFDWHLRRTPGVVAQRVATTGGHAMRFTFLGRPVAAVGLEQPLLLAPGPHVLRVRMRTADLRASRGLEWTLTCGDNRTRIADGARVRESRTWNDFSLGFEVPEGDHCTGQWLRLVNPASRGVAQALRGELMVTDVRIVPAARP